MTGKRIMTAAGMRQFLALVLVLPFLAFALVKPGTMLASDDQGRVMVILCGDTVPVEMAVAADGTMTPVKELPGQAMKHGACDWVPHGQPVLGFAGIELPGPPQDSVPIQPGVTAAALALPRMRLAPGARGPPAIV